MDNTHRGRSTLLCEARALSAAVNKIARTYINYIGVNMDKILNPILAPFSSERASKSSPASIAITYGLIGLFVGAIVLKD